MKRSLNAESTGLDNECLTHRSLPRSVSMTKAHSNVMISTFKLSDASTIGLQNIMCYVFVIDGNCRKHSQFQSSLIAFRFKGIIFEDLNESCSKYENAISMQWGIRESSKTGSKVMQSTSLGRPKRAEKYQHLGGTLRTPCFTPTSPLIYLSYPNSQHSCPSSHPLQRNRNHKSLQYSNSRRDPYAEIC